MRLLNILSLMTMVISSILAYGTLALLVAYLIQNGIHALSWKLFTQDLNLNATESGLRAAIVGHFMIVGLAGILGTFLGIGMGIFLHQEIERKPFLRSLMTIVEITTSVPSIIVGAVAYALWVKPFGHFNALAGIGALSLLMTPLVAILTAQSLSQADPAMVESALALGASRWTVLRHVKIPAVKKALTAGVLISFARIWGETAPLMFTSFNKSYLSLDLTQPMATLTVTIYNLASSPYPHWQAQAWTGCLVLVLMGSLLLGVTAWLTRS